MTKKTQEIVKISKISSKQHRKAQIYSIFQKKKLKFQQSNGKKISKRLKITKSSSGKLVKVLQNNTKISIRSSKY